MKRSIFGCVLLLGGALILAAQTNQPSRPQRPIHLVTKVGECESRIGGVDVVVAASVEQGKSAVRIAFRLNQADTACELEPSNAVAIAQVVQDIASGLIKGKQATGQEKNVEVNGFELADKKLVEVMFHRGDSTNGESSCRLWFDPYNAISLSRLIVSAQATADWLAPRVVPLE